MTPVTAQCLWLLLVAFPQMVTSEFCPSLESQGEHSRALLRRGSGIAVPPAGEGPAQHGSRQPAEFSHRSFWQFADLEPFQELPRVLERLSSPFHIL